MDELQATLAGAGQMLALDPPGDERLTVGDVFDRGLFGPRAHRYGRPRDLILGIRARLPGGEEIRGGGKVVKNVAGYDLPKLFTGAEGRLGRLLELTLRLHPLPARTCTLVTADAGCDGVRASGADLRRLPMGAGAAAGAVRGAGGRPAGRASAGACGRGAGGAGRAAVG